MLIICEATTILFSVCVDVGQNTDPENMYSCARETRLHVYECLVNNAEIISVIGNIWHSLQTTASVGARFFHVL
jgi:hypothetical protein